MAHLRGTSPGGIVSRAVAGLLLLAGCVAAARAAEASGDKAREVYRLIGGDRVVEQSADAMITAAQTNPQLEPYVDVMREWLRKVVATGEFETEMVKLYADAFSDGELDELIAFYRSPVGQKALARMPELMRRGAEIGSRIAKQHSPELEEMIAKRKKELDERDKQNAEPKP